MSCQLAFRAFPPSTYYTSLATEEEIFILHSLSCHLPLFSFLAALSLLITPRKRHAHAAPEIPIRSTPSLPRIAITSLSFALCICSRLTFKCKRLARPGFSGGSCDSPSISPGAWGIGLSLTYERNHLHSDRISIHCIDEIALCPGWARLLVSTFPACTRVGWLVRLSGNCTNSFNLADIQSATYNSPSDTSTAAPEAL